MLHSSLWLIVWDNFLGVRMQFHDGRLSHSYLERISRSEVWGIWFNRLTQFPRLSRSRIWFCIAAYKQREGDLALYLGRSKSFFGITECSHIINNHDCAQNTYSQNGHSRMSVEKNRTVLELNRLSSKCVGEFSFWSVWRPEVTFEF